MDGQSSGERYAPVDSIPVKPQRMEIDLDMTGRDDAALFTTVYQHRLTPVYKEMYLNHRVQDSRLMECLGL